LIPLFLCLVIGIGWAGLQRVESQSRIHQGDSLEIVVTTTQESLRAWFDTERGYAEHLATDPQVVKLAEDQLRLPHTQDAMTTSESYSVLRTRMVSEARGPQGAGFFIIAPDRTSIFSMREANVGSRNIIDQQRPARLQEAFEGKTVLIPPIRSAVSVAYAESAEKVGQPTLFIAPPIRNADGAVIAVLTVRFDPAQDFTRLCQIGRIGQSGETYAFDWSGMMLSESRFKEALVEAGTIPAGGSSILAVRICDRTAAHDPQDAECALTAMAQDAIAGNSGLNVQGYPDYRGSRPAA
jgi:hypothetical protein